MAPVLDRSTSHRRGGSCGRQCAEAGDGRRGGWRMGRRGGRPAAGDMREQHVGESRRCRPRANTNHCGRRSGRAARWQRHVVSEMRREAVEEIHPGRGEAAAADQAEAALIELDQVALNAREVE
jgi:hypothetical protein